MIKQIKILSKKDAISIVKQLGMMPILYGTAREIDRLTYQNPSIRKAFKNKPAANIILGWFKTENDVIRRLDEMECVMKEERERKKSLNN